MAAAQSQKTCTPDNSWNSTEELLAGRPCVRPKDLWLLLLCREPVGDVRKAMTRSMRPTEYYIIEEASNRTLYPTRFSYLFLTAAAQSLMIFYCVRFL